MCGGSGGFYKSSAEALLAALTHGQLPWERAPPWLQVEALTGSFGSSQGQCRVPSTEAGISQGRDTSLLPGVCFARPPG